MIVTLYTRAGCHLCEAAEATIADVVAGRDDVEVVVVDIDGDPALTERYTVRVPVVVVDGEEIAEYEVAPGALAAALGRAPVPDGPLHRQQPGRFWLRRLLLALGAVALLAAVTAAAVVLAAPDVFDDQCDRTQLVVPEECPGAPGLTTS